MPGSLNTSATKVFKISVLQKISGTIAFAAVALFFLGCCLITVREQWSGLFSLNEAGYPDSYILYDVLHLQKTGVIYHDLSQPPYVATAYSPMLYELYSIPGRFVTFQNPFLAPRFVPLVAFLLCIVLVVSLARALIPEPSTWLWSVLLAGSIGTIADWVLQLRGDLPGIFCNLLAVRLLFLRSRWAVLLAGLSAGFATQFKFTYVSALVAGTLWLLVLRRWKDLGSFLGAAVVSSLGVYLIFVAREPRMLAQMFSMSPGIAEVPGLLKIMYKVADQPIVLLAALAVSPAVFRAGARWGLLILFILTSLSVASVTDLQAGGNVNYYSEALFALVPVAVLGVRRLTAWAGQHVGAGAFVTVLFVFYLIGPLANFYYNIAPYPTFYYNGSARSASLGAVQSGNEEFQKFADALHGQHIFSTVPRIALLDAQPVLLEPFLMSYLQRLGHFDPAPMFRKLGDQEFDIVVTASAPQAFRGITYIGPDLRRAIVASYHPYCFYSGYLVHLPVQRQNDALKSSLAGIGCTPVVCDSPSNCPVW
jgi:hypothetical protein